MNERALSLLGMARRAGKLALGHDASIDSIVKNKASLCIVTRDASERLKREMTHARTFGGKNILLIETDFDIAALSNAVGSKAAVLTVNDGGFAKRTAELLNNEQ